MPYLEVDGNSTYYAGGTRPESQPVLFCHGSGGRHHHFLYQIRDLPHSINPLAVDLPGHGRSEGTPLGQIALYRDWLYRFIKAAGLKEPILGGHSMGGAISLDYALHYPETLGGLILLGTGGRLKVQPEILQELHAGRIHPRMIKMAYGSKVREDLLESGLLELKNSAVSTYYNDFSACDRFDILNHLSAIKTPALIVCGNEDRMTPFGFSLYLRYALSNSRLEIVEGAGHMVMLEQPEAVNRAITAFMADYAQSPVH